MSEAPPQPPAADRPGEPSGFPPPPPPPPADGGYGYGTPTPPAPGGGYGAPPPAGAGYGAPQGFGYGAPPAYTQQLPAQGEYAPWLTRVGGALLDYFVPFLIAGILYGISRPLGALVYLAAIVYSLYQAYLGGQTGQSFGKKTVGIRLLGERTGQPIGGGMGIARYFLHIVDGLPCYLGYLWPLWDPKSQTFSDKIVSTVVVKA
ncbi:MAG: RDD family protein [Actinomycetes bacterium]